ncbi:MAG: porin [Planctomycetaceae bacterium]|nr:porin [Planctomycetaceae bacterium]
MREWLLSAAAMLGVASSSYAQNTYVQQADAIFAGSEQTLVQQIGYECVDPCDISCDVGCDDCCFSCEDECSCYLVDWEWDLGDEIFCEDSGWDVGGWVQMGYHNRSTGLFNQHPGNFNLHQMWLFAEKVADGSCGLDWGGRVDFMYGVDAADTQAFGNNPGRWDFQNGWDHGIYGFALPQLYGEVAYGDVSVKAGHFYTLLGYEVVTAPDNFFYSHAFTMYNSEAFTHTGVLGTWAVSDDVTAYGGWTLGWDTGFDQFAGGNSFLGGASASVTDDVTVTYILTAGDLGWRGEGYSHSIVADVALTDELNYVFQSDYLAAENNGAPGQFDTIGINQYLFYWMSDCVGLGGRAEWWKANGTSYYSITGGVNYKPAANIVIRPELRYQWSPAHNDDPGIAAVPVDEGAIFGIDAIITF